MRLAVSVCSENMPSTARARCPARAVGSQRFLCSGRLGHHTSGYQAQTNRERHGLLPKRRIPMIAPALQPYINTREDSAFRFPGVPTLMRSTSETTHGAFCLMEQWSVPPGFASPYHIHHLEDEAFYVLEGEVAFVCDGKWIKAGPAHMSSGHAKFLTASKLPARP